MSPEIFRAWLRHMGLSERGAALALGLSRPTVRKYRDEGTDLTTALACAALAAGLGPWKPEGTAMRNEPDTSAWRDQLAREHAAAMEIVRDNQDRDRAKGEAEVQANAEKRMAETEAAIARGRDDEAARRWEQREAAAKARAEERRQEELQAWIRDQIDALALDGEQVKSGVLARVCAVLAGRPEEEWSLDGLVSDDDFEPQED